MAFRIQMTNFGYELDIPFHTFEEALRRGKSTGFEFTINETKQLPGGYAKSIQHVCSWSPIGGLKMNREWKNEKDSQKD